MGARHAVNRSILMLFLVGLTAWASTAAGHHSISGIYDSARQITVAGVVAEFRFINPHPLLIVEVTTAEGDRERWQLEMDNRFELSDIGIDAGTFEPGDRVIARGSAARREPRRIYLLRLERPADGFRYEQVGFRPRIGSSGR
jgi:hypothetical protein